MGSKPENADKSSQQHTISGSDVSIFTGGKIDMKVVCKLRRGTQNEGNRMTKTMRNLS